MSLDSLRKLGERDVDADACSLGSCVRGLAVADPVYDRGQQSGIVGSCSNTWSAKRNEPAD